MGGKEEPRVKVERAQERLRASFAAGRTRPVEYRKQQLNQIIKFCSEREKDIAEALKNDLHRSAFLTWLGEIYQIKGEAAYALAHLNEWAAPKVVSTPLPLQPATSSIVHEPYGMCLILGPWNFPFYCTLIPVISAIAAGNCVVLKPSELAPASSAVLAKLFAEYLDPQCFTVIEGDGSTAEALLEAKWDHIFFTGSTEKGKLVAKAAAENLTPVVLELGGKNPCIVDQNANLRVAARRIIFGKFINAGQICVAPDYVLAHKAIERDLLNEMKKVMTEFFGKDPRKSEDFGRLVTPRHAKRLADCMKDGEIVVGGKCDVDGRYVAPTILRHVQPDSLLLKEEIFGPILPVVTVPDVEHAIAHINRGAKPLALYYFGSDEKTQKMVISNTSSGTMAINETVFQITSPELPFGGVGSSGLGSYHGVYGFQCFSHAKALLTKGTRLDPSIRYPPFRVSGGAGLMRSALEHVGGAGTPTIRPWNLFLLAALGTITYAKVKSRL